MGKVKEFLQDDKKTTILAFVGSVILLDYYLIFYFGGAFISIILYQTSVNGFAIYFTMALLKMYKENSFHSIKFSTDHGYATSLDMTVYSWKEDIENGESIMQIEFRPIEYGKDYDLVHNPDKYVLFIDGTEIK